MAKTLYATFFGHVPDKLEDVQWLAVGRTALECGAQPPATDAMLTKKIVWYGRMATLACDGRCDKAWGINRRPRLYFMEDGPCVPRALAPGEKARDDDDHVYVADSALDAAPADPGTYEGVDCKPYAGRLNKANAHLINKWCARECERSRISDGHEFAFAGMWVGDPGRSPRLCSVCDGPETWHDAGETIELPDLDHPRPNMLHRGVR
jgi:hypothetical protein